MSQSKPPAVLEIRIGGELIGLPDLTADDRAEIELFLWQHIERVADLGGKYGEDIARAAEEWKEKTLAKTGINSSEAIREIGRAHV